MRFLPVFSHFKRFSSFYRHPLDNKTPSSHIAILIATYLLSLSEAVFCHLSKKVQLFLAYIKKKLYLCTRF